MTAHAQEHTARQLLDHPVPRITTGRANLDAITGLRFFAAAGVVLYHFALPILRHHNSFFLNVVGAGYTAVDLFFLLSGFILSFSYLSERGRLRGSRRNFYVSRLARIYPAYLVAFVLAAPSDIATSLHVNSVRVALEKLLVNGSVVLGLVQAWTPFTAWSWNFPAWSVSVEAFFYLVFPVLGVALTKLRPNTARFTAVLLWLLAMTAPFLLWQMHGTTGPPGLGDHLQMAVEFTPLLRLPEFLLGILVGQAFLRGEFSRLNGTVASWTAVIVLLLVLGFWPSLPHPLLANGLLAPLFALLIVSLARGTGPIAGLLSLPAIVVLGEASYSIYILQIPVALALKIPPPYTSVKLLGLYLAVLLLASLATWRFIETPMRRLIRRWLGKPEQSKRTTGVSSPAPHAAAEW